MKRSFVLAAVMCGLLVVSGCGTDVRENVISLTIESLTKAAGSLASIKEAVAKWDSKDTKEADKAAWLKKAMDRIEGTNSLRTAAQGLLQAKQAAQQLEPASKEVRDEYFEKYQKNIQDAVKRVQKEQDALNEALRQAEQNHPDQKTALAELKQKLQLAQGEFEVQTKQQ
jgi:outer membrane murein-binding lipoprotein Lpp